MVHIVILIQTFTRVQLTKLYSLAQTALSENRELERHHMILWKRAIFCPVLSVSHIFSSFQITSNKHFFGGGLPWPNLHCLAVAQSLVAQEQGALTGNRLSSGDSEKGNFLKRQTCNEHHQHQQHHNDIMDLLNIHWFDLLPPGGKPCTSAT